MRAIIGRVLGRAGYRVDLTSTLREARELEPGGYDAVLVDARLGADQGTDLIDDLAAADPGMLRRCLIVTGGPAVPLPAGVATLKKPFDLNDLLTAVRGLHGPDSPEPARPEDYEAREANGSDGKDELTAGIPEANVVSGPDGAIPPGPRSGHGREPKGRGAAWPEERAAEEREAEERGTSGGAQERRGKAVPPNRPGGAGDNTAWRLLSLARRLRARERAGLADFLHDGPIQDLAAASLELQLLRRSAGSAQATQLDAVLRRLEAVARPLRVVVDEAVPVLVTRPRLAHTLEQRAGWLGTPLAVAANAECADLTTAEVDTAVDVAELMLLAMTPGLPPAQAEVEVRVADGLIGIGLALVPAAAEIAGGDRPVSFQALRELAAALSITMGSEFGRWRWRAWTSVPRAVPPGQGGEMAPATLPGSPPSQELPAQALPRPRGLNAVTWP